MNRLIRSSCLAHTLWASLLGLFFSTFSCLLALPVFADGDHGATCTGASFAVLGARLEATHEPGFDRDVFRLDVVSEGIVRLEIVDSGGRDARLRLRGRDCAGAETLRHVERTDQRLAFVADAPGSYYFEVSGHGARRGSPYALRTAFAALRDAVDLVWAIPADPLDACGALAAAPTLGVKSDQTDEHDPVIPPPPPQQGGGGSFLLVPLQPREVSIGVKSAQTDEHDPVIPPPPPKSAAGLGGEVVVLTESIDPLDTDVVLLRTAEDGYFAIDAEGAAVAASLFAGSSCRQAVQLASGVPLDGAQALVVPAGEYVLRIEPQPEVETAGRYWLRIRHLIAADE